MPVVFAQPQPFSPTISSEAGAAEQFTRFAPILQRQQEAVAEQYARNFATSASLASANADRGQRGAEFAAGQDFRRQALQVQAGQDAAQMQLKANMALQAEQSQMAEMRERARLQTEVNQAELSHREKVEMNRLQMALGAVQNNPDLTAQEKNDLALQLQTKIDPYQQRVSRARVQQEELQNQQIQKQLAQQDIIAANRTKFMTGQFADFTHDVKDAEGNYLGTTLTTPDGKVLQFKKEPNREERTALAQEQARQKHEQAVEKHNHERAKYATDLHLRIARDFDAQMQKEAAAGSARPSVAAAREGNIKEEFEAAMKVYDSINPRPQAQGGDRSASGPAAPEEKPFNWTDPKSQSPSQKSVVSKITSGWESVRAADLPFAVKDQAFQASQDMGLLLGKFGSAPRMREKDPEAFAEFVAASEKMDAALKAAAEAPAKGAAGQPKPDARSDKEKFEQGDLVTTQGAQKAAASLVDQLRKGELVTVEKILGKSPDGRSVFQRFDQGDLITLQGVLDVLNSASPFNKRK